MSRLRYHEIVEADHRILNPFTEEKLVLLGQVCRLQTGQRMLDLACGKAELLATWAHRYGIGGVGVDLSEVFLAAARARVEQLGVDDRVKLVQADAGRYQPDEAFDLAGCIGATWIGGGLAGTLRLLGGAVKPDGLILVGEPYWTEPPPAEAYRAIESAPDEFTSLAGTLDRFEAAGLDLVEMVLANTDSWDRYEAMHWAAADRWIRANPSDPEAALVREQTRRYRRAYLTYGRRYLGWGVFVLRQELRRELRHEQNGQRPSR
jgi:SAM-dependent methyltransferase